MVETANMDISGYIKLKEMKKFVTANTIKHVQQT